MNSRMKTPIFIL